MRDEVRSSPYVMQKISSEARKDQLPHFDVISSLIILQDDFMQSSSH